MTRDSEPLQHATTAQRDHYAARLETIASRSNGPTAQRIREAAMRARGEFYDFDRRYA